MKTALTFLVNCLLFPLAFSQGEPLPYTSGFDNAGEQAGWQEFRTGYLSTYSWNLGGGGFSAPTCLSHDYNVGGNPGDIVIDWFVSPPLNLTAASTVSMKVKTGGFSTPTADNCEIWFSTDDPDPATGNYVLVGNISYMEPQYQWLDTSFSLPFTTGTGYLAIKYKTVGAAWMTYQVDNITVDIASGVAEDQTTFAANAYPNPFSATTTLQLNCTAENATLTICNSYGQVVKEIIGISGNAPVISRDDLPAGLYFFRLFEDGIILAQDQLVVLE